MNDTHPVVGDIVRRPEERVGKVILRDPMHEREYHVQSGGVVCYWRRDQITAWFGPSDPVPAWYKVF